MRNLKNSVNILGLVVAILFCMNIALIDHFIDLYFVPVVIASLVIWAAIALIIKVCFILANLPTKRNRGR